MTRRGFTLIEIVFVIVILGILATIAIPKLSNIQDEALVTSENGGISAIRTSLQALHGKILLNGDADLNVTITKDDGSQIICTIKQDDITNGYPKYLSLSDDYKSLSPSQSSNDKTLALLLDSTNRKQWKTKIDSDGSTKIIGPASSTLTDKSSTLNNSGSWIYTPISGAIVYKPNNQF